MVSVELRNKRILVTGGAGFIGSHLVERLLQMKNHVVVYDNFDDFYAGKEANISPHRDSNLFTMVRNDILNFDVLASVMDGADIVFHQAAQCGVRYSIRNPGKTHEVNVKGTLNLLLAAKQTKVKRVIYASSSGIFGAPLYMPMDENHPTNPTSPYGVSKLAAEKYCRVFYKNYGVDTVSLRYFSVYGPRGRPDQVIHAFLSAIQKGENPVIYGDGTQTRDFTFVSDIVEANIAAAECEESAGEIFNIGYGREISINELFRKVVRKMEKEDRIQPSYKKSYEGEFPRTFADNRKAQRILGWEPKVGLEEGLKRFIESFTAKQALM